MSASLPSYGLNSSHTYESLISNPSNRFLFRPHHCESTVPLQSEGFIATKFKEYSVQKLTSITPESTFTDDELARMAYIHVRQWNFRYRGLPTSFVSASFNFPYAGWEGGRRNVLHGCNDTLICVIDTHLLRGHYAILASTLLASDFLESTLSRDDHETAIKFASAFQEVLVWAYIPTDAIITTQPLDKLLVCLTPLYKDLIPKIQIHSFGTLLSCVQALLSEVPTHQDDPLSLLSLPNLLDNTLALLGKTNAKVTSVSPNELTTTITCLVAAMYRWNPGFNRDFISEVEEAAQRKLAPHMISRTPSRGNRFLVEPKELNALKRRQESVKLEPSDTIAKKPRVHVEKIETRHDNYVPIKKEESASSDEAEDYSDTCSDNA